MSKAETNASKTAANASKTGSSSSSVELVPEEAAVLKELQEILGEPIPYQERPKLNYATTFPKDPVVIFGYYVRDKHIYRLGLSKKYLQAFPECICNLLELEELNLGYNNLQTLPDSIGNLRKLERLDLWDCNLSSLPTGISKLYKLHFLELGYNKGLKEHSKRYGDYYDESPKQFKAVREFIYQFRELEKNSPVPDKK